PRPSRFPYTTLFRSRYIRRNVVLELDATIRQLRREGSSHLTSTQVEVHFLQVHGVQVRLPPDKLDGLVNEKEQVPGAPAHAIQLQGLLLVDRSRNAFAKQVRVADDRVEWRAQFMRNGREELRLRCVGLLRRTIEPGLLQRHGCTARQLLCKHDVGLLVPAAGTRAAQRDRSYRPTARRYGHYQQART